MLNKISNMVLYPFLYLRQSMWDFLYEYQKNLYLDLIFSFSLSQLINLLIPFYPHMLVLVPYSPLKAIQLCLMCT